MSRIKLLKDVMDDAENLASSIGVLLTALNSDEEPVEKVKVDKQVESVYEIEEVRRILADKSRLGFTEDIRELLEKYGAKKLSEVSPNHYQNLVSDVEAL